MLSTQRMERMRMSDRPPKQGRKFYLTRLRLFANCGNVKITQPLRLAKLEANEAHVEAFKALAHLTRLQVFFFLVRARREVPAGEIQEAVDVPGPTLSHHLDLLRRAGLIRNRREERYVYYSVRREMVSELVRLLTACC
jgi:DNA-binding transcriptional ArsR family regulator